MNINTVVLNYVFKYICLFIDIFINTLIAMYLNTMLTHILVYFNAINDPTTADSGKTDSRAVSQTRVIVDSMFPIINYLTRNSSKK